MTLTINKERLASTFTTLCEIDSPSKKEGKIADHLKNIFSELGADFLYEDNSAPKTGAETGNLIIRFNGNLPGGEGLFLACHMDTVQPGEGIKVVRNGTIFTSEGDTILGGDDKSGIASIIELLTILKENKTRHSTIEIILTTCEEIGLLGAKSLEHDKLKTKFGYALDSSGTNQVIIGAPAAMRIDVEVCGVAAHAGLCPEAGINALTLTASALTRISQGRIDKDSTRNFGVIQGGVAANIVPEKITLQGEVRSHSPAKLDQYSREVEKIFRDEVAQWRGNEATGDKRPSVTVDTVNDYPALTLDHNEPVIKLIKKSSALGTKDISYIISGGGSDASIFCGYGLPTAIISTGMKNVHTVNESLDLEDLVNLTELLYTMTTFDK